jgi:hypothetical protein
MRTAIALVTAAVVTSASAQNANETRLGWIGGAGDTQCDKWLEAREKRGATVLNLGLEGWVLGFVSGGAIAFSNAFSNFTENDVFDRIDFYCREHRSDILAQAAMVALADMLEITGNQRGKNPKKR